MNLQTIINAAADEADDFLAGVTSAAEARSSISEWLSGRHPGLSAGDRQAVIKGVLDILAREGFFETDMRGLAGPGAEEAPERGE